MNERHRAMLFALRAESCSSAEWKALVAVADLDDLRAIIKECCLTATSTCCNRTRIGMLATALVERTQSAARNAVEAGNRAMAAEHKLQELQDALQARGGLPPGSSPATKTKPKRLPATRSRKR